MARSNKIALMAAPLCVAALLTAPARAEDSLFAKPNAGPPVEAPAKPVVKPKPKPVVKRTPAKPKPAEAATVQPAPVAAAPVAPEQPSEAPTAFGQQMPRKALINRFSDPAGAAGVSNERGAAGGNPSSPVEAEEETLPNGMPKKFLLNRLFDSSALEPAQPDPRSFMAQAPAAEPSLLDRAAGALGFGDKEERPAAANLPPVNVTAPVKPERKPKNQPASAPAAPTPPAATLTPPPAAAPSPPGWFDRATNAIGLGGNDEPVPDYSERPKLAVPQNRDALPAPRPAEERRVQRPANAETLTRPPAGFTEKVQGTDGKVSGFTDQDEGKKGFFNWF